MIGRTLRVLVAALVLGSAMMAAPTLAKNFCSPHKNKLKGCKNEIKTCATAECTGLHAHDKRVCLKTCKTTIVTACKASSAVCTGSPSGAFVPLP